MTIIDTGPLVALIDATEAQHEAARSAAGTLTGPLFTVEPVVTEAAFLLQRSHNGVPTLMGMLREGHVRIGMTLEAEVRAVEALLHKYRDVPMSLADACLVRLAELLPASILFTFDSDFDVYRKHRNRRIDRIRLD